MISKPIIYLLIFTLVKSEPESLRFGATDPEIFMNVTEIIKSYGYPIENHTVLTEDGYFLSLHRIPFGREDRTEKYRPIVFLQHGLLDSSFTWVCNGPNKSLAFILADRGYDVWLANSRGNVYSKSHLTYSTTSNAFWDFSWDEMAKFDLPASIEYVIEKTNVSKLSYIGHSQGTTTAFAKFSQYSNLNTKISSMVALAPVAYLGNVKSGVRYLAYLARGIDIFYKIFSHGEFLPSNALKKTLAKYVCGVQSASIICRNILFLLAGYDTSNLNYTRLPVYVAHNPAGTSSKNMLHFAQGYKSDEFKMYDHGIIGNLYYYQRFSPPKYYVETGGIPIAIFYGGNDWLSDSEDVKRAMDELGEAVKFKKFLPYYNHMDFIWGLNAPAVIYEDLIKFISKYN